MVDQEPRRFVEGGDRKTDLSRDLRQGFATFLSIIRERTEKHGKKLVIVDCGPRKTAYNEFCRALSDHPDDFLALLVDSERPVVASPWHHLADKPDEWEPPEVPDDHGHLMVQAMEAWLIADPNALMRFYGEAGLDLGPAPEDDDVESVTKYNLGHWLREATKNTKRGKYVKNHSYQILSLVDSTIVRRKARHCERLFAVLSRVLNSDSGSLP